MCLLAAGGLRAGSVAFTVSGGVTDFTSDSYTIGNQFSTNNAITVTDLGVYSISGLAEAYQVGLWNSSGTLLASATVPATAASGQFVYVAIAPVALAPGQVYQIGELIDSTATWLAFPTVTSAPEVTFIHGVYDGSFSLTLTDPTTDTIASNAALSGAFGPSFEFVNSSVPEPSTFWFLAAGAAVLWRFARIRTRFA